MEITWRVINRGLGGGERGKGTENKQHKWQVENRQGEGKNSVVNVEAKELISRPMDMKYRGGMWEGGDGQDGVE